MVIIYKIHCRGLREKSIKTNATFYKLKKPKKNTFLQSNQFQLKINKISKKKLITPQFNRQPIK